MPLLRVRFGHRLKSLRNQNGLTQAKLAELSGMSVDFISMVERGERSPSFETLEILAKTLKVTVSQLFEEAHESPR